MSVARFLGGIAVLIWRSDNKTYLLLRRAAKRDVGAGNWECVTGRLEQGGGFEESMRREVLEELSVEINIEFLIGTSHFFRGAAKPENELIGVMYCCTTENPDAIKIGAEHSEARWLTAEEVYSFLPPEHWLYRLIQRTEFMRPRLSDELRQYYREHGFESS
jgi:8-oxo-dGTP diphosphatase